MKKVLLTTMCITAIMAASISLKAQEVTVTLIPGWTWISYPSVDTVDFATAFENFTPMQGDVIRSQWGQATYTNGRWRGSVTQFYPGYGYHYMSNRSMPVLVTFHTQQPAPQVVVTTMEPTDIITTSATCGGIVTSGNGDYVSIILRGVCWSTNPNPTFNDSYIAAGNGLGSFTVSLSELVTGSTYYVRAFAVTPTETFYGEEVNFTLYDFVDLGLPHHTLWATCNVGANSPEEYGDYFAWAETQPKNFYFWSSYQYAMDGPNTLTKYCDNPSYGYNGYTDNLTVLLPEDDAASVNWSTDWRTPTKEEWQELFQNTTQTWTTQNGVEGKLFTAPNGNSLFIPAAGYRYESPLYSGGSGCFYWSSTLCSNYPRSAWDFSFGSGSYHMNEDGRFMGLSIRPVRSFSQSTSIIIDITANPVEGGEVRGGGGYFAGTECTLIATAYDGYDFANWTENGEVVSTEATYSFMVNESRNLVANFTFHGNYAYVDLGLPSGTLWATCNVGAGTPEHYGNYYAWGEIQPKNIYYWSTYQHCNDSSNALTKYCNKANYGYNGYTDNLTILMPEDDAATANWGEDWRMPTKEEWQELRDNTTSTWTTQNGVSGWLFTASNGNSLFLPASGSRWANRIPRVGEFTSYWSSSLDTDQPSWAWRFYFASSYSGVSNNTRVYGFPVRAVRSGSQNNVPTGAIKGKFTINSDGDQVYFSQGNLQYQASTNTWRFADNQWDYVGEGNANISQTYDGWIDLFGWGTSGWNNGNFYYHPWDSNNSNDLYGPPGQYNLTGSYANADWGVYNPISNGGNQTNQWRTLTQPEWAYVFNTRSTTSGIRYAKAQVNGVNGVILLPNDWSSSTYSFSNTNTSNASYSSNTISAFQWAILENAGAVFLPAAGRRIGASIEDISYGYYWSASCNNYNSAHNMYFNDGGDLNTGIYYRHCGFSVRVVCPAE